MLSSINMVVGFGYRTIGIPTARIVDAPTFAVSKLVVQYYISRRVDKLNDGLDWTRCKQV